MVEIKRLIMKVRIILAALLLMLVMAVFSPGFAQDVDGRLLEQEAAFSPSPQFGMQLGTSFTAGGYGGSMFSQTISPHLGWDLSKNFHLEVGTVFSSGKLRGNSPVAPFGLAGENTAMQGIEGQRFLSATVYAYGSYRVNPRLSLTGGTWVERNDMGTVDPQMNPMAFDTNARGMMFGVDYKITDNLRFGAEVSMSSGVNPFNPLQQGHFSPHRYPAPMPFYRRN